MAVAIVCDFCGRQLDVIDGVYKIYRTKELNTKDILPCLCKTCACKLDEIIAESKTRFMKQVEIIERTTKLNKERREELDTNG